MEASCDCVAQYDEVKLHLVRHQLINEILVEENKEKRKYFVYKHTVPNGKVYIGITCCESVELHWFGGWDNITHEILYQDLYPQNARNIEMQLIKEHRSTDPQYGYNKDKGGKISTTPYIWKTWVYDAHYQTVAKRLPYKVMVNSEDLNQFKNYAASYDGEIIECVPMDEFADQYFVGASNPSYKEKQIREAIRQHIENNNSTVQVEYLYGAVDGLPFEIDKENKKFIARLYVVDKRDYKLGKVMEDLQRIFNEKN